MPSGFWTWISLMSGWMRKTMRWEREDQGGRGFQRRLSQMKWALQMKGGIKNPAVPKRGNAPRLHLLPLHHRRARRKTPRKGIFYYGILNHWFSWNSDICFREFQKCICYLNVWIMKSYFHITSPKYQGRIHHRRKCLPFIFRLVANKYEDFNGFLNSYPYINWNIFKHKTCYIQNILKLWNSIEKKWFQKDKIGASKSKFSILSENA